MLKKATINGRLLRIPCEISSCSVIGLLGSRSGVNTFWEIVCDTYKISGIAKNAVVSLQPSRGSPPPVMIELSQLEPVVAGSFGRPDR